MSKPLKEDYIIRIKSRIEQHVEEPAEEEEKEEFVELMTRGQFVQKGGSYYITYKETETTGYEGCTTTLKIGYGSMTLGVTADEIICSLTEKGGTAKFGYLLDANSAELVSRNRLEVTVTHVN